MSDIERIFGNSSLHDYKIGRLEILYSEGHIILHLFDSKNMEKIFRIEHFLSIDFTNREEWGKGTYIVSSDVFNANGILNIEIQLNSGDICSIKCQKQ